MSFVGKETGLKCEGKLRDAKRFTPTTVGTPGGCVLATRDGTLLPGVQTICPPPGMREYGLLTSFRKMQFGNWKLVRSSKGGQEIGPAGWKSAAVPPM